MAEFKRLSDVSAIESMKDGLNVLVEDAGEVVKLAANSMIPEDVALKSDIPTNVSALDNDAGYLTEHQDLSEYAKNADVIHTPVSAAVGQTIVVKAVDVNGKPTEWEAADIGSGLPEGATAHQQLVTDAEGAVMWEDKPFYETRKFESKSVYMEETVLSPVESPTIPVVGFEDRTYERSGLAHIEDANYAVIWNGVHYPFAGYDYKLVLGDGSSAMFFYGNLHILNDAKVAIDGTEYPMFEELTFEDTGEPFAIMKFAPRSSPLVLFSAADTIEGVVCEIVEGDFVETVKTLDPKYLPQRMVVTLSDMADSGNGFYTAVASATYEEIKAAHESGVSVIVKDASGLFMTIYRVSDAQIDFIGVTHSDNRFTVSTVEVMKDGNVYLHAHRFTGESMA